MSQPGGALDQGSTRRQPARQLAAQMGVDRPSRRRLGSSTGETSVAVNSSVAEATWTVAVSTRFMTRPSSWPFIAAVTTSRGSLQAGLPGRASTKFVACNSASASNESSAARFQVNAAKTVAGDPHLAEIDELPQLVGQPRQLEVRRQAEELGCARAFEFQKVRLAVELFDHGALRRIVTGDRHQQGMIPGDLPALFDGQQTCRLELARARPLAVLQAAREVDVDGPFFDMHSLAHSQRGRQNLRQLRNIERIP